jgi:hypothetical protein
VVSRFEDDGERGWFIAKAIAFLVGLLVVGLVLDGFGVGLGGYVVLAVAALYVIVVHVVPFWPSRRP